ncbi:MAG: pyruvate dehydrogenase (acetyl-transferring), homodimeric type [Planctomycetes bacterium]|jgi:pyruvate dehydrogenase E1 component|nr:pyruvate dehydrogenase (acetyl-transferring), homodimeric type [Planctomycetota bacterium]
MNDPHRDTDPQETGEWLEALDATIESAGPERARWLLDRLMEHGALRGAPATNSFTTPYLNTIPRDRQPLYPGDRQMERRIKSLVRWNAMAMVVRANRKAPGIGGHISTYASAATLYEVGFNHFFRARTPGACGDIIYFQGHASPGIYARAFLEGRISREEMENFRRELAEGGGLSSYPHPRLMRDFWEFPTVSMGLGPIMAIYQARFNRYLEHRGLLGCPASKVWAFVGDGETDEPETLGALTLASREKLDNLIFVVNCNLQRLDGPVRGNGKIIQELEAAFRGAGWNVIKLIWGDDWDRLIAADRTGNLVRRMQEAVDGDYQNYTVKPGSWTREHFFAKYPDVAELVAHLSDEELRRLRRGGHDPEKVYAAYKAAVEHRGSPTVILAKTVKGYGLGEAGEGRNITHQQKKLNEDELRQFRDRFSLPFSDEEVAEAPFYRPPDDADEIRYLAHRRKELGGPVPTRVVRAKPVPAPDRAFLAEMLKGSGEAEVATTMSYTRLLARLLKHETVGRLLVPIVPDEARTFGMDALFRQVGIYASQGQKYDPVDSDIVLYYKEAKSGQILEEGITEAGSMSSFVAAGTAYSTHGVPTVPIFTFYSMFGFQRVGDLVWAAADARARGFLMGATAGRTTLAGEGLQHQDGHSHLMAGTVPCVRAYDPAFGYELTLIMEDGLRRMLEKGEDLIYYVTLYNEKYPMPDLPPGVEEGVLGGLYLLAPASGDGPRVRLLGSGTILREVQKAAGLLADRFGVRAAVYSATSFNELRREAIEVERRNRLHPDAPPRTPFVARALAGETGPVIAATDYMRLVADQVSPWVPGLISLGTDGFGRSDHRAPLRDFFEVDAKSIAAAALYGLARDGGMDRAAAAKAIRDLGVDPDRPAPWTVDA